MLKKIAIIIIIIIFGYLIFQTPNELADETIVLEEPSFFQAVAQVYISWHDATDSEVIEILSKWYKSRISFN